VILGKLQLD
jgi:hypothetical protein